MSEAEAALAKATGGITTEAIAWALVVLLGAFAIYNLFCGVRKNFRDEKKRREQPTATLEEKIKAHDRMLDNDKRRLDEMERKQADMQRGQMANCKGVQALLEHELHNGNTVEMQDASKAISDWLLKRP